MEKYLIRIDLSDKVPEIEITPTEYFKLEISRNILLNALAIEEKYGILIVNYLDYERRLIDISLNNMVYGYFDYFDSFDVILSLNTRLLNLLTSVRLYVDQVASNVRECIPNITKTEEEVKNYFTKEFEQTKEYRFMEALRNFFQHHGLAVHRVEYPIRRTSEDDNLLEYSIGMASLRSSLEKDSKINKKVLAELEEKVDLVSAVRIYVESISSVHESVRNMITGSVKSAREVIEDAHQRYRAICCMNLESLSAFKILNGKKVSSIPLLLNWDDVRIKIQGRNRKLINLRKSYVTSRIKVQNKQ